MISSLLCKKNSVVKRKFQMSGTTNAESQGHGRDCFFPSSLQCSCLERRFQGNGRRKAAQVCREGSAKRKVTISTQRHSTWTESNVEDSLVGTETELWGRMLKVSSWLMAEGERSERNKKVRGNPNKM